MLETAHLAFSPNAKRPACCQSPRSVSSGGETLVSHIESSSSSKASRRRAGMLPSSWKLCRTILVSALHNGSVGRTVGIRAIPAHATCAETGSTGLTSSLEGCTSARTPTPGRAQRVCILSRFRCVLAEKRISKQPPKEARMRGRALVCCTWLCVAGIRTASVPTFEEADETAAIASMAEYLPWTAMVPIEHTCLLSNTPYTIRFKLRYSATKRTIDCLQPWRTRTWICVNAISPDEAGCV